MVKTLTTREVQEELGRVWHRQFKCVLAKGQWAVATHKSDLLKRQSAVILHLTCSCRMGYDMKFQVTYIYSNCCYACREKIPRFVHTFRVMLEEGLKNASV